MKRVVYFFPQHIHCGMCGALMEQVEHIPAGSKQRYALIACTNFYAKPHDGNCAAYGIKLRIEATESALEVVE